MEFSHRSLRFLVEAVRFRIEWYEHELLRDDLDDDARSDLTNDHGYFCSLLAAMTAAVERDQRSLGADPESRK
jgi:hypothetical protein